MDRLEQILRQPLLLLRQQIEATNLPKSFVNFENERIK